MSILGLQQRYRELGRLRLGAKTPSGAPKKLDTWRLTSQDRELLDAASLLYGGITERWTDDKHDEWQLLTTTSRIPVLIPPQDFDGQQNMELWGKGGRQRRCDTVTCWITTGTDGTLIEQPCLCDAEGEIKCKPSTTLRVWLPDLPAIGSWTLHSTGWNAAQELVTAARMVAGRNMKAYLGIEHREVKRPGEAAKQFVVPVLHTPVVLRSILEGGGIAALAAPSPGVAVTVHPLPPPLVGAEVVRESRGEAGEADRAPTTFEPEAIEYDSPPLPPVADSEPRFLQVAAHAIEQAWADLNSELDSPPDFDGKMADVEVAVRSLFRRMWKASLWPEDALHAALRKRGVAHVGDLKKAELAVFAREAWAAAAKTAAGAEK